MGLAPEVVGELVGQVVSPAPELTRREREVVQLMADGHSNRAIAGSLYLSEATIKTHLVRIYRKLGVDNRAAAVSEAVRRGLLELTQEGGVRPSAGPLRTRFSASRDRCPASAGPLAPG